MNNNRLRVIASVALVVGALFGMAGTFVPSAALRGLAWGLDGVALVIASALLAVHHFRHGHEVIAAGFVVFAIGEGLILSVHATDPVASVSAFGAGAALWAAALALISLPNVLPVLLRSLGLVAALLFAVLAVQIFAGSPLTPLSTPLPFYAYPFLAATLLGWAWVHGKPVSPRSPTI